MEFAPLIGIELNQSFRHIIVQHPAVHCGKQSDATAFYTSGKFVFP